MLTSRTVETSRIKTAVTLWRLGRRLQFIRRIILHHASGLVRRRKSQRELMSAGSEASGGFLGVGQRAARPYYQENVAGAEWVAVSNQFFTTLMAPLTAKATGVWGRRFDIEALAGPKAARYRGCAWHAGISVAARTDIQRAFRNLRWPEALPSSRATPAQRSRGDGLRDVQDRLPVAAQLHEPAAQLVARLRPGDSGPHHHHQTHALANSKQSQPLHAPDGCARAQNAGAARQIQRRSDADESGGDEAVQAIRHQSGRRLFADDDSNPDLLRSLQNARPGGGIAKRKVSLGKGSVSAGHRQRICLLLGWPINIIPLCMAATQVWLMAMTPKTGDPTQRRVAMFMPLIFLFICYNFAAALALYYTAQNLFSILQFYQNKRQPMPTLEKLRLPESENDDDAERSARHHARLSRFRCANRGRPRMKAAIRRCRFIPRRAGA